MAESLEQMEENLVGVEESLLTEFNRIRKLESSEAYSEINPRVQFNLEELIRALQHNLCQVQVCLCGALYTA